MEEKQNELKQETFGEMIMRSVTPISDGNDGLSYSLLLSDFLWAMASLITNVRGNFLEQNTIHEFRSGGEVIEERREPHVPNAFDLLYFDSLYGWNSTGLRVQFHRFIQWLIDQEIDEELPDIGFVYYANKWNEFIALSNKEDE